MSASYSDDLTIGLNRARFLLGDTDTTTALLQDAAILAMLASFDYNEAVAQLAMGLASDAAQDPDSYEADGGLKLVFAQKIKTWQALAKDLRQNTQVTAPAVPRSGLSVGLIKQPDTRGLRF